MNKSELLANLSADRDAHVALLQRFIQAPSPNPPGETLEAANVLAEYLASFGVLVERVCPDGDTRPNLVCDFVVGPALIERGLGGQAAGDGGDGGKGLEGGNGGEEGRTDSALPESRPGSAPRVIMNGHLDVFPVDASRDGEWTHGGPWSGFNDGTYIHGRGGVDMKAGTAASVIAYAYLFRHREQFARTGGKGSVALTLVSDEETGGRYGSRWLLEQGGSDSSVEADGGGRRGGDTDRDKDRWKGDVMINAEPGGLQSIRFGEKGTLRITFTITCKGVHGAYTHLSEGANRIAARFVIRLVEVVESIVPDWDDEIKRQLSKEEVRRTIDEIMGPGAVDSVMKPTVNIGTINGGIKVNMIPDRCVLEADIRLPIGLVKEVVLKKIDELMQGEFATSVSYAVQEAASNPPSHCSPNHDMVKALENAAHTVTGRKPVAIPSLGATDAKFWRYHGVPAYVFGVSPETMAAAVDERVSVDEFLAVVRTHALAVWEFLGGE